MLILDKLQTAKCRQLQMILNYSQADWIMQNIPKKRCQMILKMVRFLTSEKIFQWWTLNYEPIKLLSRSDMSYIKYNSCFSIIRAASLIFPGMCHLRLRPYKKGRVIDLGRKKTKALMVSSSLELMRTWKQGWHSSYSLSIVSTTRPLDKKLFVILLSFWVTL